MKIIVAPDSYKESLTASEVANIITESFRMVMPASQILNVPLADGGEGTVECLLQNKKGKEHFVEVTSPMGEKISASFGVLQGDTESTAPTAIIEIAKASGLSLVPKHLRNPLKTSSYGSGELIRHALDKGCRRLIIGLGGSATTDCGMGALAALGVQFKDAVNQEIPYCGEGLLKLAKIDLSHIDPRLSECEFVIAHDVLNPLIGLNGAIQYAAQKGASGDQLDFLLKGFEHFSKVLFETTQKEIGSLPGTGAAGGMAAGLYALLNARLQPGALWIMEELKLREKIKNADLVITGEGQVDAQTIQGKTPIAVAKVAKTYHVPVIAITAKLGNGYKAVYDHGIDAVFSISNGPMSEENSLNQARTLLETTAYNIAKLINLCQNKGIL